MRVAKATIERFVERASRLYEQKRIGKVAPDALGMYIRRWMRRARSISLARSSVAIRPTMVSGHKHR